MNDVLFLTETQLTSDSDLDKVRNLLDKFLVSFNENHQCFSGLAICYQSSPYIKHHQKGDGITILTFFNSTYSSEC